MHPARLDYNNSKFCSVGSALVRSMEHVVFSQTALCVVVLFFLTVLHSQEFAINQGPGVSHKAREGDEM